jgi:type II secretory pathway pseudopilin PulG
MQLYSFFLFTFNFLHRPRRGQSLVEAVVAVAVVLLLVTGLIVATTSSVKFSTLSSYRTQATQIAKEVMEAVRDMRDSSWTDFITKSDTTYCLSGSYEWTILPPGEECAGDTGDFYIRTVIFELQTPDPDKPDQKRMKVTVTIGWAEGTSKKSATLVSYFTNWKTL